MTISGEAAGLGFIQSRAAAVRRRRALPQFAAAFAAIFLAGAAPAIAATPGNVAPGQASSEDAGYRALFLNWQRADQPRQDAVAVPMGQPVYSTIMTSGFGVRSDPFRGRAAMHPGIDLAGPLGTPVYATADGVVDRSEWNNGGYGNLIEIDHGQGIQTRYGHLSQRIALPGQHVHRGDLIGLMGSTGRSTGSHLHYEVRIAGRAVNPIAFVPNGPTMIALREQRGAVAEGGPRTAAR
jgi:murein DD-endopeptidase MepM/ murein hydrolase activator NlpD